MTTKAMRSLGLLFGSAAFALISGCAPMPTQNQGPHVVTQPAVQSNSSCNPVVAGVIGALAGSLAGKGKGHLVGAGVGAAVGALACTAYNYHARKVRDAQAVEAEYTQQRGALPQQNTVTSYRSSLSPSDTVQAGQQAAVQSRVVLLRGVQDRPPRVTEKLTIYSPDGKALTEATKEAADVNGTGEYQTDFSFSLPKGVQNGRYIVRSSLYLNNQQVSSNDVPMVVVG